MENPEGGDLCNYLRKKPGFDFSLSLPFFVRVLSRDLRLNGKAPLTVVSVYTVLSISVDPVEGTLGVPTLVSPC